MNIMNRDESVGSFRFAEGWHGADRLEEIVEGWMASLGPESSCFDESHRLSDWLRDHYEQHHVILAAHPKEKAGTAPILLIHGLEIYSRIDTEPVHHIEAFN
jgi:hypothetical protein